MDRVVRTNNVHRTSQSPLVIRDWSVDRLQVQVTDQIFKWAGQPERKPFATQTQHSALLLRYQKHKIVQVPPGGLAQFKSNSIPEQKKSEYVQHPSWIPTKFEYSVAFPVNLLMLWVTCQHLAPSHSVDNDRDVRRISSFPEFLGWKIFFFLSRSPQLQQRDETNGSVPADVYSRGRRATKQSFPQVRMTEFQSMNSFPHVSTFSDKQKSDKGS